MPVQPPETIVVDDDTDEVRCDGGGTHGHPMVWYSFDGRKIICCGYCDREFIKQSDVAGLHHHA